MKADLVARDVYHSDWNVISKVNWAICKCLCRCM